MLVSAETLIVCVCSVRFCVVCVDGGVSLLSVTSGQHNSDMTFPRDVKMQEMGVTAGGL